MPEYSGLFRKMPVNASGMDFTLKCRHFPNPGPNLRDFPQRDANGIANSEDRDQTALWVCTVCPDLSV